MAKKTPTISVIERRLQGPSVHRTSSQPIPLMEPGKWVLRWENSTISPDHMWNIVHNLGWQYAEPGDLDCPIDEIGATERDGKIVRGVRGEEAQDRGEHPADLWETATEKGHRGWRRVRARCPFSVAVSQRSAGCSPRS